MARSIETIYNSIIEEKEAQASLTGLLPASEDYDNLINDLSSTSKVAIWRLWAYMMSVAIHVHEAIFDLFKAEVESIADSAPAGTAAWYQKMMLAFQYGHALVYSDYQYDYASEDTDAKIIKYCAVSERSDGVVIVKVAKEENGEPVALLLAEKSAAESYANKIKFAGTRLALTSLNADIFAPVYDIYYDPIIPLSTIQSEIQTALDNYRKNLGFDGLIRITTLTDVIQAVTGVIDPVFQSSQITPEGGSAISVPILTTPAAGYFAYNDTAANMFNYIPEI